MGVGLDAMVGYLRGGEDSFFLQKKTKKKKASFGV